MAETQTIVLLVLGVFGILGVGEILRRNGKLKGEYARKFDHILVGTFVAFWPHFISRRAIVALSVLALGMAVAMRTIKPLKELFKGIYSIERKSYGDYLFPMSVGVCALLFAEPIVFASAILVSALADGMAAVAGVAYGIHPYHIGDSKKTLEGSSVFLIITVMIFAFVMAFEGLSGLGYSMLAVLAAWLLTFVEAILGNGFDNLVLPVITGAILIAML